MMPAWQNSEQYLATGTVFARIRQGGLYLQLDRYVIDQINKAVMF